jgi:ElaA protein
MDTNMDWHVLPFKELSTNQLYQILKLRQEVFILEQNCFYLDADDIDLKAFHLIGRFEGKITGYARIVPAGIVYEEIAMGRIIIVKHLREKALGIELMHVAFDFVKNQYGHQPIRISAQTYLISFYEKFGFRTKGKPYMDAGIEHIEMLRPGKEK